MLWSAPVTGDQCCGLSPSQVINAEADVCLRQKVSQASQMFSPAELMTTRCICCSCHCLWRFMSSGSGLAWQVDPLKSLLLMSVYDRVQSGLPISDLGVFSMFPGCENYQ